MENKNVATARTVEEMAEEFAAGIDLGFFNSSVNRMMFRDLFVMFANTYYADKAQIDPAPESDRGEVWHDYNKEKPRLDSFVLVRIEYKNHGEPRCTYDVARYVKVLYGGFMLDYNSHTTESFVNFRKPRLSWRYLDELD